MEDPEFRNACFKVFLYRSSGRRAYILTPNMIRAHRGVFGTETKSQVRLSFYCLTRVLWRYRPTINYFEPPSLFAPADKLLDPSTLAQYFEELKFALAVVDELNLNTRIWTKR
jgi:hypothetical protein